MRSLERIEVDAVSARLVRATTQGEIDRSEFHRAVAALGLTVPKKDVDKLFDEWDLDGGGAIAYQEMTRILKKTRGHVLIEGVGGKAPPSIKGPATAVAATTGGTKRATESPS